MNKFIGIGRLTKDIEVNMTSNNKLYLKNSIAIKNDFKNSNGEYDSEFVNIVVWGNNADYMGKYSDKGMMIAVEGRLTTRSYDKQDGTTGYITEVVCNNVELLEKRREPQKEEVVVETAEEDPFKEFGDTVVVDDNFLD